MRAAGLFLLGLSACTSTEAVEFSPPPVGEHRSLVVLFDDGASLVAMAVDLPSRESFSVPYDGGAVEVHALLYDEALAARGLEAGTIDIDPFAEPIEAPAMSYVNRVDDSGETGWDQATPPAALLDRVRPKRLAAPCDALPRFDVQSYPLVERTNGRDAFLAADGRVVVTTEAGTEYFVTRDGIEPTTLGIDGTIWSHFRAADGTLWLGVGQGRLFRGSVAGGFELVVRTASTAGIQAIAGPDRTDVPFELYLLSWDGTVHRYADGALEVLIPENTRTPGDIIWFGPQQAGVVRLLDDFVTMIDGTNIQREQPGVGGLGLTGIYEGPDGLAATLTDGSIQVRGADGVWQNVGVMQGTPEPMVTYEGRLLVGGNNGWYGFILDGRLCDRQAFPANAEEMLVLGDDVLVVQLNSQPVFPEQSRVDTFVSWLVRE